MKIKPTHVKKITEGKKNYKGKPDLSVIILNYNAKKFLKDCLVSLEKQEGLKIQTIVVDNNSSDESVEMLKKEFNKIDLVERSTPKGFSAGNNAGVPLAKANTVLFLNPDMKFLKKTDLKKCYEYYYSQKNIGVMTCRIDLALTGGIDETCHRGFPTPWASLTHFSGISRIFPKTKLFGQYLQTYKDIDTEHEVDAMGGMFMLMSRKVGEEVDWWDEDYPLYGEDLDFCYVVREKGYKNMYWPKVKVVHYKGVSTGMSKHSKKVTTASKETTKRVKGWSMQAMEIFYKKHYQKKYPFFINRLVFLGLKLLKFKRVNLA
ncbi:glycosyltransferase family 2 protein [Patescibacteria group bacterium]